MELGQATESICATCHSRKMIPWADCGSPFPQCHVVEPIEKWLASAQAGNYFHCQLGAAVTKDVIPMTRSKLPLSRLSILAALH